MLGVRSPRAQRARPADESAYACRVNALVWWLIPAVATVLAVAWVTWVNRPRPPADPHDTLREHERFKQALERQRRPDGDVPRSGPEDDADR